MVRRFCPKCGKSVESLVQTQDGFFCHDCAKINIIDINLPDQFEFYECVICKKISPNGYPDSWMKLEQEDLQNRLRELISRLLLMKYLSKKDIQADIKIMEYVTKNEKIAPFQATINLFDPKNEYKKGQYALYVKPHYTVCTNCSRRRGHFFAAVVQIRGDLLSDINTKQHIFDEIQNYAKKLESENDECFVAKVIEEKQGFDLQVSSRHMAELIASFVKSKWGGRLEESKRLMGRGIDGGEVFRNTIAVHLFPFDKNFLILFDDELYLVININSKITTLFSLERKLELRKENKYLITRPPKVIATPNDFLKFEVISEDNEFIHFCNQHTGATISEIKSNFPQMPEIGSTIYGIHFNNKTYFFSLIEA